MHTFLLDLWHDLREKRLWPVAALLLVGIAAVPVALRQDEQSAPAQPAPPARAETASDRLPTIAIDDVSGAPSRLSEFSQRNPFKPLNDLPKTGDDDAGENQTVDLGASPDGDSAKGGSGGSAGTGSAASSGSSGGSSGSGSGGSSAGSAGGSAPSGGSRPRTSTTYFAYRADIRFGPAGKTKEMKQVKAFTLLGSDDEPAAMFMGVTDDHRYAVFAVDVSRYESDGEHVCKPSPERCEFVYLRVGDGGNETTLTSLDGRRSYHLELTAIKRVILDKATVENVPTENDKSGSAPADKRKVVDSVARSLFDILAQRR